MAIGPETNALIDSYKLKIEQKQKNKLQILETIDGYSVKDSDGSTLAQIENLDVVINRFDPAVKGLDTEIVRINGLINVQQTLIFDIYTEAWNVGCATTGNPVVETYRDDVRGYTWSFSGDNPFTESNTALSSSNVGYGTYTGIVVTGLGTFYDISSGVGTCVGYATSISTAESTITTLRSQRQSVQNSVNYLKDARAEYQLQKYGYDNAISQLDAEISEAQSIITALEGSDSQFYLE